MICLVSLLLATAIAAAWDGDWTDGKSMRGAIFDDPGSSHTQAGTDPPQKFTTPPPRDFADVDPEELDDYFQRYKKEYTPYALTRVSETLRYGNVVIPKGYYLLKPGDPTDGSPRVSLQTENIQLAAVSTSTTAGASENKPEEANKAQQSQQIYSSKPPGTSSNPTSVAAPAQPATGKPASKAQQAPVPKYRVFILKSKGKVIASIPIHRMEPYSPLHKDHISKRALAWIDHEDRHPVLKFYFKKWIYSTDFQ